MPIGAGLQRQGRGDIRSRSVHRRCHSPSVRQLPPPRIGDGGGEVDAPGEHRAALATAHGPVPWRVALESAELRTGRSHPEKPPLRWHLCLRADPYRAPCRWHRETPRRADGPMGGVHSGCSRGLYRLGRIPPQPSHHGEQCRGIRAVGGACRGAAPRGSVAAIACDLRSLRTANGPVLRSWPTVAKRARTLSLPVPGTARPLWTEDLPEHSWRSG